MEYVYTIHCEVSDVEVSLDIISLLETFLPYMADNVLVLSEKVE